MVRSIIYIVFEVRRFYKPFTKKFHKEYAQIHYKKWSEFINVKKVEMIIYIVIEVPFLQTVQSFIIRNMHKKWSEFIVI